MNVHLFFIRKTNFFITALVPNFLEFSSKGKSFVTKKLSNDFFCLYIAHHNTYKLFLKNRIFYISTLRSYILI